MAVNLFEQRRVKHDELEENIQNYDELKRIK